MLNVGEFVDVEAVMNALRVSSSLTLQATAVNGGGTTRFWRTQAVQVCERPRLDVLNTRRSMETLADRFNRKRRDRLLQKLGNADRNSQNEQSVPTIDVVPRQILDGVSKLFTR